MVCKGISVVCLLVSVLSMPLGPASAEEGKSESGERPPPVLADHGLRTGDEINARNHEAHPQLVTPGIAWGIRHGWRMPLIEARRVELPRRYREATERFSAQVRLSQDGLALENYVAGRPFPVIDPADPMVAYRIMWNYYYNFAVTDDADARNFEAFTGAVKANQAMEVERRFIVDHYRKLNFNGRLYVDPHPELPNPERVRFKESIHPILEPFDMKGVGATFYRYLDPARQDDSWIYVPQLRKVRRMSTAQRSDSLFGQDTDVDSYSGYNGHIAWMDYKFLGERVVLGCLHAQSIPARWQTPEDWLFHDVWEPRSVWIIEATSKFPQYAYGKRLLYIDKETFLIPHSDIYDRAGELWKAWINMFAIPEQDVSEQDDFPHGAGAVIYDVQLSHVTKTAIPSEKTATNQQSIFINMGKKSGTTEDFFSVAHLISTGR